MALAERAELVARLSLKDDFSGPLKRVTGAVGRLEKTLGSARFRNAGAQIGTGLRNASILAAGGLALLGSQVARGLESLVELERLGAQTNAVIKSTGGVAGITAGKVRALAEEYESLNATIDDKVIQNTENLLLTFTSIRKEAFEPALAAVLDMNAALGGGEEGLQSVAIQVGKALQDPIRGITALRRVGVNFSADQIKVIKELVESNRLLDAQKLILAELNTEFGGSFLAQGNTTAGKVAKFKDSIEDLQKALATAFLPVLGRVSDKLSTFLAQPETLRAVEEFGAKIAGLFSDENISKGAAILGEAFDTVRAALPGLKDAAQITGQVLSTAVGLFKSLPPDLQKLAIGALAVNKLTGGLVTNLVGGIAGLALSSLRTITAASVTVIGASVTGGGLPGAVPGGKGGIGGALGTAAKIILPAAAVIALLEADPTRGRGPGGTGGLGPGVPGPRGHIPIGQDWRVRTSGGLSPDERGVARLAAAIERAGGLSPDERDVARQQKAAVDRTYDALERLRAQRAVTNVTVNVSTTVSVRDYVRQANVAVKYGLVAS